MNYSKIIQLRLFILKRIFSFLDFVSHVRFSRSFIIQSKIYIGTSIISTATIQTACTTTTKPIEQKNEIGEKGIDTASTKKFAKVDSTGKLIEKLKTRFKKKIVEPIFPDSIQVTCYEVAVEPTCYEPTSEPKLYYKSEIQPEFHGGNDSLMKFIKTNIQYPQEAIELGAEGACVIQFVVGISGKIEDIKLLKSTGNSSLDSEAIRVISILPAWKPGSNNGESVRVVRNIPIIFKLPVENTTK